MTAGPAASVDRDSVSPLRPGFWWPGTRGVGVVLLHELGASPEGLGVVGERIVAEGFWAAAPMLPGHEDIADPGALARVELRDWKACVDQWYASMAGFVPQVVVAGFGLGGCLAVAKAAAVQVAGLTTVSTPLQTFGRSMWRRRVSGLFAGGAAPPALDRKDPNRSEMLFERLPPGAFAHLAEAEAEAARVLGLVTAPALVFHSREDHVVSRRDAWRLYEGLGSASKELVWLERSFHQAWIDHDAELIGERVARFCDGLEIRPRVW
jgi:carboxylesterase